ncbi:hypothetical protein KGA65_00465 [Ideonella sp. B7]|uniref:hypothetical protein n=1 Tax=Ideonella benzenivorans TaxID=2831643 RepID=UPI001CEDDF24|nr:hypothetical protein [Ideonella benzenivorans]MCA6215005.1 hypothetical protein [Ideonella benzenivorans]
MFEDLEVGSQMSLWAACILLVLAVAGVVGGLWVREWRQAHAAPAATHLPQGASAWSAPPTARTPT